MLLGVFQGSAVSAQTFDCTNLNLDPDVARVNETIVVEKRDRLQLNETMILRIRETGFSRTQSCIAGEPTYVNACTVGFISVMEFSPNEVGLSTGSYTADFTIIDAIGGSSVCSRVITVSDTNQNYCNNVGLGGVNPGTGNQGTTFGFQGCAGGATSANRPTVLITDPTQQNRTVAELAVSPGLPDGDQPGGMFVVSSSNFVPGIYDAQLYISAAAQGGSLRFEVDTGESCQEARQCTVNGNVGTQMCYGVRQNSVCSFETGDCDVCRYCGDSICSKGETLQTCPNDCSQAACGNNVCELGEDSQMCPNDCEGAEGEEQKLNDFDFCQQLPEGPQRTACNACIETNADTNKPKAMYTAVGCVQVDNQGLVRQIIQMLLSVGGLVALLSILAGAFIFSTSQGDAAKVKQAKEMITSSVTGILFIVFSTIILDFIGVQILRLPGLS